MSSVSPTSNSTAVGGANALLGWRTPIGRAPELPRTVAKRQRTGERADRQHECTRHDGESRDVLRWCVRWILCGAGQVRRDAAELKEKPGRRPHQDEGRQQTEDHCGADTRGASMNEIGRRVTNDRRWNPEADEEDEAGEAIRHGCHIRVFGLTPEAEPQANYPNKKRVCVTRNPQIAPGGHVRQPGRLMATAGVAP